jgi:hypothetical protein
MKTILMPDIYQALSRIPAYLEDWCKLKSLREIATVAEAEAWRLEICRKWGIPYPPYPPRPFAKNTGFPDPALEVVSSFSPDYPPLKINCVSQAIEIVAAKKQGREPNQDIINKPVVEGRYLYIRVDLERPPAELRRNFEDIVKTHQTQEQRSRRDRSDHKYYFDKWNVYDRVHSQKITVTGIVEEQNILTLKEIDACRKYVERVLAEACQIIQIVSDRPNQIH